MFYCNGKKGTCDCDILCADCEHFDNSGGNKVLTNADRIRAMTDEELAVLLNGVLVCDICVFSGTGCTECFNMERCIAGAKTWLAMTAEEKI